ncbi:hypothetical protein SAMN05192561_11247 [Halopenitus malekzadehii]|uniref:Uncharacterized protein n=1 Tax=Halopenitus malekzadehii TaxID=1267564 RepID=A0A1H6JNK4_9EURY|nr:hypothetical protein [Halopenitus malekzadehii]SEH60870.1 hypothetical protein SAMN05192561_11247 [Halopenitus malekzadehii]
MPNLNRSARKLLDEKMEPYVDGFDSMLADVIHDTFADDPQLCRLATIVNETNHAIEDRDRQNGVDKEWSALNEASQKVTWVLERRTREVIAEKCETVALDAPGWTDVHSKEKIEAAVREAVEWLNHNTNPAERAGVTYGEELPDPDALFEEVPGDA